MFIIIAIITILLAILYAILISYFNLGWSRLSEFVPESSIPPNVSFSIIIPARNEELNIINCLNDIINQEYPSSKFEIIVIDDFSEDKTAENVDQFISNNPKYNVSLIRLSEEKSEELNSFKKFAITIGIKQSGYDWIITSDADCRHGKKWLSTIAAFIVQNDPILISAPVTFQNPSNFFEKSQSLEFLGLIAIGAASIANKSANLCNGANLIYKKDAFYEVGGFKGVDDIASGDDEFLMHKIHAKWPDKIAFLKSHDAIAYTQPAKTLSEFIQQRKRWVSKSRKYANKSITGILISAYLYHLCLLLCLVFGFCNPLYFIVFIVAFGFKVVVEFLFLKKVTKFFNQSNVIRLLVPSAFLYIIYVLFIGIYGNFGKYEWKGRRVK